MCHSRGTRSTHTRSVGDAQQGPLLGGVAHRHPWRRVSGSLAGHVDSGSARGPRSPVRPSWARPWSSSRRIRAAPSARPISGLIGDAMAGRSVAVRPRGRRGSGLACRRWDPGRPDAAARVRAWHLGPGGRRRTSSPARGNRWHDPIEPDPGFAARDAGGRLMREPIAPAPGAPGNRAHVVQQRQGRRRHLPLVELRLVHGRPRHPQRGLLAPRGPAAGP